MIRVTPDAVGGATLACHCSDFYVAPDEVPALVAELCGLGPKRVRTHPLLTRIRDAEAALAAERAAREAAAREAAAVASVAETDALATRVAAALGGQTPQSWADLLARLRAAEHALASERALREAADAAWLGVCRLVCDGPASEDDLHLAIQDLQARAGVAQDLQPPKDIRAAVAELRRLWQRDTPAPTGPSLLELLTAALPPDCVVVEAGGNCPVQVELDLPDGARLYFRARDDVSVEVWAPGWTRSGAGGLPDGDPEFAVYDVPWAGGEYAGWIPDADVVGIVVVHVGLYLAGKTAEETP